jgi:outer membrane receptor protein involved in Fe transport
MKSAALCLGLVTAVIGFSTQSLMAQTAPAGASTAATPASTGTVTTGTSTSSNSTQEMEPIIVTGSAIPTTDTEGSSPVTVINSDTIQQRGYQTVQDVLRNLPQAGGFSDPGLDANGFTPGASYVSLRGLGPQATLVLINGRRVAYYPAAGNGQYGFVDVSGIPTDIIDHIEVLTEGTALYGADAVAGVINIITKKDLPNDENGEADVFEGNTTDKDAFLQRYTVMGNLETFDKNGFGVVEVDYTHQNSQFAVDQNISSTANQTANGGFDLRSGRTYPGLFQDETTLQQFTINPGVGNVPLNPANTNPGNPPPYDYNTLTSTAPDSTRYGAYANYTYKFYDGAITPNIDFNYQHNRTLSQSGPTGYSFADGDSGPIENSPAQGGLPVFIVPANNPYNTTGHAIDILSYRFAPFGPRIEEVDSDEFRGVSSVDFKLGDGWTLNAGLNYSYSFLNDRGVGLVNSAGFQNALNSTNPATAYNPFTSTGFQNPGVLKEITAEGGQTGSYSLFGEDFRLNGSLFDLPAGPVQIAFGGENRIERYNQKYSNEETSGDILGEAPQQDTAASRKALSGYTEVDIPMTSPSFNIPGFYSTDVLVAGRVDKYSTFGSTENPQVRLRWEVIPGLVLRGGYSKAFRAPSLNEIGSGGNASYVFVNNPKYTNPISQSTIAQVEQITPGNPDLKPETAETFSFGVAYSPAFVKGLLLTADYFKIRYDNQIQQQDAQTLVNNNSPQVHYLPSGAISLIDVNYANLNNSYVEGFDWGANYVLGDPNTDWGQLTFNISATYYRKYIQDDGSGAEDYVGTDTGGLGAYSRYRQDASITWGYHGFSFTVDNDYTSGFADGSNLYGEARNVDAWFVWNMQASYTFDKEVVEHDIAPGPPGNGFDWRKVLEGTTVSLGCNNIVNEQPPFVADPNDALGYDQSYSDGTGRFLYGELTKKF